VSDVLTLDQLLELIRVAWPDRYSRGRVTHLHRNALTLPSGAQIHLRVLIQTLVEPSEPTPRDVIIRRPQF
jgi:hypothetical protein